VIPVKQVMNRNVLTFREDTPVDEAARILNEKQFSGAPVVAGENEVVGIVSEVDIFTKPGSRVGEIMSQNVISVTEDTGINEAARLLAGERIRRLPVLKRGKLVGLLSRSDVLTFFTQSHWTCRSCGHTERGLEAPEECRHCGGKVFTLERTLPGT
jgi:tRNA nucleotidyltransferase (CCA-adding enzyme)